MALPKFSSSGLSPTPKEIEAWRDEVARDNEEENLRPRPGLVRDVGARALATEAQVTVPIEEPEELISLTP